MATVNTNDLRIKNARNLIDSFNVGNTANGYVFLGRVQPWADDNLPPIPQTNFKEFYTTCSNMVALNRIQPTDAYHMIPKTPWVSGVTYDRYQHNYSVVNKSFSGASNLYDAKFVVLNNLNTVYVCLNNKGNSPSTVEPRSTGDDAFITSDGYQWLRLYSINNDILEDRSTNNLMPVAPVGTNEQTDGAVYTVLIENGGAGYTSNPAGTVNQLPAYFAHIVGDGKGAVAKVTVSNSVIIDVEVVRPGLGYTFANLDFTSGDVYANLGDLDLGVNGLDPLGNGALRTSVIISPPGGWGSDLVRELGGTRVGVFSTLNTPLFVANYECPFRQIGILQDFEYNGVNPTSLNACFGIRITGIAQGQSYIVGETIEQEVLYDGKDKIAKGTVVAWNSSLGVLRYVQGSENADTDGNVYPFFGSEDVVGVTSKLAGSPFDFTGELADMDFTDGYANPDITQFTGLITYLTNISPITRDPQQSERITLVVAF